MSRWQITETPNGLQLAPVTVRGLGAERLTWADLLYNQLDAVQVYVLSFPSRFDLPLDTAVSEALRTFGANTPASTSVNFWDPTDPEFSRALGYFDLNAPPALVFVPGFRSRGLIRTGQRRHISTPSRLPIPRCLATGRSSRSPPTPCMRS